MHKLAFLLLLSSGLSQAFTLPKDTKWICLNPMSQSLNTLKLTMRGEWKKNFHVSQPPSYKIPTAKIGEWAMVGKDAFDHEVVTHLTPQKNVSYSFDPQNNCTVKMTTNVLKTRQLASGELFTDVDLAELATQRPDGILFIWSPHMALSLRSMPEIQSAAAELKLPLTFALDPQADNKAAQKAVKDHHLPEGSMKRVDSMELSMRNALIHYPTLIVFREGKICETFQRGYRSAEKFRNIITTIFGACK